MPTEPAARCPKCRTPLVRAETGWACPKVLSHVRILSDLDARRLSLKVARPRAKRNAPA